MRRIVMLTYDSPLGPMTLAAETGEDLSAGGVLVAPGGPAAIGAQQAALVGLEEDLDSATARLGAGRDGVLGAARARGPVVGARGAGGVGRGHQSLTREM